MLNVTAVRPLGGARLWLQFNDGQKGEVDLSAELEGAVFEPLQEPAIFKSVIIDTTTRTTVWPNGADFAPEFLASLLPQRVSARP